MNTKPEVLVTDTLFIGLKHEAMLRKAGYSVIRLKKLSATEEELVQAIRGKVGYLLGGIERVSKKVIDNADMLKAIAFMGIDYKPMIPVSDYAKEKGIEILNTPDGPTQAVAEWALSVALMMNRQLRETGRSGNLNGSTVPGIENQKIGIIGYGRIGKRIAEMITPFRPASISYFTRHPEKKGNNIFSQYVSLQKIFTTSDIIFLCIPMENKNFIGQTQIAKMKKNALLISILEKGVINEAALFDAVQAHKIRAAVDYHPDKKFDSLPNDNFYYSNMHTAFNTFSEIDKTSTMAVEKLIAVLKGN